MKTSGKTNWELLEQMDDKDIDYSDIPETDKKFWADAKIVHHQKKVDLTIQLDEDIAMWLNKLKGYNQTVNSILRSYFTTIKQINTVSTNT